MEIKEIRRIGKLILPLSLAMLVSGMTGCNQSIQNGEQESAPQPVTGTNDPAAEQPAMSLGDGLKLEGDKLKAFLKLHAEERYQLPEVKPAPTSEAGPLLKTAAACDVNFNSYAGLNSMADKANAYYATAPWYSQTCGTNIAYVVPTTYQYYYLEPELTNHCRASNSLWGTKSGSSCIN